MIELNREIELTLRCHEKLGERREPSVQILTVLMLHAMHEHS